MRTEEFRDIEIGAEAFEEYLELLSRTVPTTMPEWMD